MPLLPIVLILISCFTHAGWNLLARRGRQELAFFRRMMLAVLPIALGTAAAMSVAGTRMPTRAWLYGAASGGICGFYYLFLGLAYRSGDFTVVYPVARALPVLLVAAADVARGRRPGPWGWAGLVLVVGGCALAPQVSYRNLAWHHYRPRTVLWMALTALTIFGFTVLDKLAAEAVPPGPASAALYCALFHVASAAVYLAMRGGRSASVAGNSVGRRDPALAAALGFASYLLVLWAYQMAPRASYLLAFRQFSIVLGVAAAFWFYRERGAAVRVPASLAIVGGLTLLALSG